LTHAATFEGPRAELEMWHPSGAPPRRLVLGPHGGAQSPEHDGLVDVAVIAPSPVVPSRAWLDRAIAHAADRLDRDGVLWLIVPRRSRPMAERAVARRDLVLLDAVLAIPGWPHSAHLVPIARDALCDAGARHLGLPRALARVIASLAGVRAGRFMLRRVAPSCALLAARGPGLPVFEWLGDIDGAGVVTATVSSGTRRDARVAAVLRFSAQRQGPDLVVKAALDGPGQARLQAERAALERIGPTAVRAGAAVPLLTACSRPWALAAHPLPGRSAAAALGSTPRRLAPIAGAVADWLQRWNIATAARALASREMLEEMLLGPIRRLVEDGTASDAYRDAMARLAERLQGASLVLVAAHNDLTMSNVLADGRAPGILDWESANATGLPLTDLWYALADGVARAGRISHAAAVEALVNAATPAPTALARMPAEHASALGLTADQAALAFHCCWFTHADDERRRHVENRRFAAVVRVVDGRRLLWSPTT
jgi:hypothetical protein